MKRAFVFAAVLAAFVSCSVEKQDIPAEGVVPDNNFITITATQEGGPQTRTVLDEDLIHVLWTPGDQINLFYQDQNARFVSTNDYENTAIAKFQGHMSIDVVTGGNEGEDMPSSYFWGLYPYSEDASFDEYSGTIETSLPSEQIAANNTFASNLFITIGRSTSWSMPFYNVCSGIRFTVDQEGVMSVILRSNGGKPLAGRFRVGMDEGTERPVVTDVLDCASDVRVFPPDGQPCFYPGTYYYIVTLPGTHENGITIELEGLPEARVSTTAPVTFKRSRFIATDLTADRYYADRLPLKSIDLNIENEGVRRYLAEVDYSNDLENYNNSYITNYLSFGKDKPEPVRFNWKSTASRSLKVVDSENGKVVYDGDASGSVTEVYNLIPGRKYSYHVDGDISWDSTFTPEGTLRMIDMDGVSNVRDLGGWRAGDKTIKYGKIYRGAMLDDITPLGREVFFNTLNASVDVDLRGTGGTPGSVNGGSNTLGLQDYYNYAVSYFQITGTSGSLYANAIRDIIRLLSEDKVVYFHCMVGADRTGTLAFLLEALLGVSESDLSKDFELTSFFETRTRNGRVNPSFALARLKDAMLQFPGATIQDRAVSWAYQFGIWDDDIEMLKDLLLE